MKKISILFFWLKSLSLLFSLNSENLQIGQQVYISAPRGLNMRDQPSLRGNKVTALSYNSKILIRELGHEVQSIQGKSSRWIFTQYNGKFGWIFGGFVSHQLNGKYEDDFTYYLGRGRSENYSIHISMAISEVLNILGEPDNMVGFMGQPVHIYENPSINIYGEKVVNQISWSDDSGGTVFGLLPKQTSEVGVLSILGSPDDVLLIQPNSDGEAINVGKNFLYYQSGFSLLINFGNGETIKYISLEKD